MEISLNIYDDKTEILTCKIITNVHFIILPVCTLLYYAYIPRESSILAGLTEYGAHV